MSSSCFSVIAPRLGEQSWVSETSAAEGEVYEHPALEHERVEEIGRPAIVNPLLHVPEFTGGHRIIVVCPDKFLCRWGTAFGQHPVVAVAQLDNVRPAAKEAFIARHCPIRGKGKEVECSENEQQPDDPHRPILFVFVVHSKAIGKRASKHAGVL